MTGSTECLQPGESPYAASTLGDLVLCIQIQKSVEVFGVEPNTVVRHRKGGNLR